ncbi:MAG: hypothetical protein ACJ76N_06265 [Thermoanaerobaculia bacterium]
MQTKRALTFILGVLAGPAILGAWTLEPCNASGPEAQSRAAFRQALATAAPGSPLYTPHPFPKSQADVVDNFLYYHRNAFSGAPAELPDADRRFFELLDTGKIRFEMIRVENWNPLRCGPRKERAFYYVVRAFNSSTGEEVLRASVEDNGHVARVRHKPDGGSLPPVPALADAAGSAQRRLGLRPQQAQYIAAWGTLRCDEVQPCVSFEDGANAYVMAALNGAAVYRIDSGARLSFRRDLQPAQIGARADALRKQKKELMSLGFDSFSAVSPVAGSPQP